LTFEEPLLSKIKSLKPSLNVVDLREGISLRKFLKNEVSSGEIGDPDAAASEQKPSLETGDAHDHHDHDEHAVGAPDPHHWMDPRIAARQIDLIAATLSKLDSVRAKEFGANAEQFKAELNGLHNELSRLLAPFHGREFFVFHPAYGYFADAYQLTQVAIEFEGKEPSSQQLTHLIERARKARIRSILVQPQYASKGAQVIAEALGAEVVIADPLPRAYVSELQALGFKLVDTFTARAGGAQASQPISTPQESPSTEHP
jgi:zinc transport system substrate-binding protein